MSTPSPTPSPRSSSTSRTGGAPARTAGDQTGALQSSQGGTSIADGVVRKIAGIAAREVGGVHDLGSGTSRAFGALRERIPGSHGPNVAQGVAVEVGERQAAVDVDIIVEYGVAIADLAAAIRRNVIASVERMTGLEVTEVNVSVDDIHLEDDSDDEQAPSRVQ